MASLDGEQKSFFLPLACHSARSSRCMQRNMKDHDMLKQLFIMTILP